MKRVAKLLASRSMGKEEELYDFVGMFWFLSGLDDTAAATDEGALALLETVFVHAEGGRPANGRGVHQEEGKEDHEGEEAEDRRGPGKQGYGWMTVSFDDDGNDNDGYYVSAGNTGGGASVDATAALLRINERGRLRAGEREREGGVEMMVTEPREGEQHGRKRSSRWSGVRGGSGGGKGLENKGADSGRASAQEAGMENTVVDLGVEEEEAFFGRERDAARFGAPSVGGGAGVMSPQEWEKQQQWLQQRQRSRQPQEEWEQQQQRQQQQEDEEKERRHWQERQQQQQHRREEWGLKKEGEFKAQMASMGAGMARRYSGAADVRSGEGRVGTLAALNDEDPYASNDELAMAALKQEPGLGAVDSRGNRPRLAGGRKRVSDRRPTSPPSGEADPRRGQLFAEQEKEEAERRGVLAMQERRSLQEGNTQINVVSFEFCGGGGGGGAQELCVASLCISRACDWSVLPL